MILVARFLLEELRLEQQLPARIAPILPIKQIRVLIVTVTDLGALEVQLASARGPALLLDRPIKVI